MKARDMRLRIAHAAARLIAQDGSLDYGSAKRKAARQLGAADGSGLPDNLAVEEALRAYQSLYCADTTQATQSALRTVAYEYMQLLADFDPHLTGSVLNGTAGPNSDINLQLFTDQEKELEFLLMKVAPDYRVGDSGRAESGYARPLVFLIPDARADVTLSVYSRGELRQLKRFQADGSPRRMRLAQLDAQD
jgi:hypothetical protein